MFCTHSGSELEPGAKFCTNCGAPVEEQQTSYEEPEYKEPEYHEPEYHETEYNGESGQQEAQFEEKPAQKPSGFENLSGHLMVGNWSEIYLWILALLPLITGVLGAAALSFALGILLIILDYRELQKRNGVKIAAWVVVLGAFFNIVYLIARPHGTSKNYKPLILYLILTVIFGFLRVQ